MGDSVDYQIGGEEWNEEHVELYGDATQEILLIYICEPKTN